MVNKVVRRIPRTFPGRVSITPGGKVTIIPGVAAAIRREVKKPEIIIKPPAVVEPIVRPPGLRGLSRDIEIRRGILRTQRIRGQLTPRGELELAGLVPLQALTDVIIGTKELPQTIVTLAKKPEVIKKLPAVIKKEAVEFGELLDISPTEAVAQIGAELLIIKGTSKGLSALGKLSRTQLVKLSPKFVGAARTGRTLRIKTAPGKFVSLRVVGKIPTEKLSKQIKLIKQKKVIGVSSQADALLGVLSRRRVIRKPIPREALFTKTTRRLLTKFDKGKITKREIIRLDFLMRQQGAKGLLERSLFIDPKTRIRPSRLGIKKEEPLSILDLLTEDLTFRKQRPQILLFEDITIEKLPKDLRFIGRKLARNKPLTQRETNALLQFQLRTSGKAKPLGFVSRESEITLAPGEILKRVKKVGITIVNGERVPIIKVAVFKPKGKVKDLLTKFRKRKITKSEEKKLDKLLKKQTGLDEVP